MPATPEDPSRPSAGRILARARWALLGAVLVLLAEGVAVATGWRPAPVVVVLLLAPVAAGFGAWVVLGGIASRRMVEERDAGYSTVYDAPGFAFRDWRTGAVLREAGESPTAPARGGSLVARMLRVRPGSWLDRRHPDD
jgi:hypothetical protein